MGTLNRHQWFWKYWSIPTNTWILDRDDSSWQANLPDMLTANRETWNQCTWSIIKTPYHKWLSDPTVQNQAAPNALLCSNRCQDIFVGSWRNECQQNRKLQFYCTNKKEFGTVPCLDYCRHPVSSVVARWRMSAHKLNRETGRYGEKNSKCSQEMLPCIRTFKAPKTARRT